MDHLSQPIRSNFLLLIISLVALLLPTLAITQSVAEDAETRVRSLSQQLVAITGLADAQRVAIASELASERLHILQQLLRSSPEKVRALLLTSDAISGMPSSVQALLEQNVEERGTLEVVIEDSDNSERHSFFLERDGQRIELYSSTTRLLGLRSGNEIRVHGYRLGTSMLVDANSLQIVSVGSAPTSLGPQSTVALLVNFQDDLEQPYTADDVRDVVFNTTSNFFLETSFNQAWLTGDVFGWLTIPLSSKTCPTLLALSAAVTQAANAAQVNLSKYNRQVLVFPRFACDWRGASSLGGNPSVSAINGSLSLDYVGHEMGHGFGILHSHSLECPGASIGTNCSVDEYGDRFDIMGDWTASHQNAFQKEHLGWLNSETSPSIATVDKSGIYTIDAYETPQGVKAIKVLQNDGSPSGQRKFYYLEYRQLIGFDSALSQYPASTAGVLIHSGNEGDLDTSLLLNMNPQDDTFAHAALSKGQTFVDSNAGVTIQTLSADSSRATVNIQISGGSGGCHRNPPQVIGIPSQSDPVSPGALVHYTLTVTNKDSLACPAYSFLLATPVAPAGWAAVAIATYFTLAPGESVSTDLQVTSASTANPGDYPVNITALAWPDYSLRSATTLTYTISGAPVPDFVLSTMPDKISLQRGTSGSVTVHSAAVGGFSLPVTVSASQLPADVTAQFTPATIPGGGDGDSILILSAGNAAPLGNATIAVNGSGGTQSHTAYVLVTITSATASLTSISVTPATPSLMAGSTVQFHATGIYSNGSSSDITNQVIWSSDKPAIASINASGLATAISAGSTSVSAMLGGITGSTTLTVTAAPANTYTLLGNAFVAAQDLRYSQGVELGLKFTSEVAGSVLAIRFFKSNSAFGTHVGELWTISGQRLTSAVFTNESANGWQQVNLSPPVSIQGNTPYVVSYHSDGPFSYVGFPSSIDKPPLHAPASGVLGGNGVYALGPVGTFPGLGGGSNYLVDVVFSTASISATLMSIQITPSNPTMTKGSSLQFRAMGTFSNGSTSDITSQVNWTSDASAVASINAAGLATAIATGSARIFASLSGISSYTTVAVTNVSSISYSLLGNGMFATQEVRYSQGVEVGLKFISDVPGSIVAIRFYKSASAFGTHVGELWTITGQKLASALFTNENASGWQQVNLTAPIPIKANTAYIVSYHADGPLAYVDFPVPFDNPPLHAPVSGTLGGNGVYALGPVGTFPGLGGGSNYLVDVVFVP